MGPITVVRETTKGQVKHRLREQRKAPGSLLESSVPLTKKSAKIAIFLERKKQAFIKNIKKLKLRLTIGLIELLTG